MPISFPTAPLARIPPHSTHSLHTKIGLETGNSIPVHEGVKRSTSIAVKILHDLKYSFTSFKDIGQGTELWRAIVSRVLAAQLVFWTCSIDGLFGSANGASCV